MTEVKFVRRYARCLTVAVTLVASLPTGAGPAYLSSVGPTALRFHTLPQRNTNQIPPLPPALAKVEEPPAKAVKPAPVKAAPAVNMVARPVVTPTPAPAPTAAIVPASPLPEPSGLTEPSRPDEIISPQMLMKYFVNSTNGVKTGVIAPIGLNQPASTPKPSSQATYSVTPGP